MSVLRVGCPMWAHRPWVGPFYPSGTKPGTELALYTTWCNAVEGNTTFYAEPSVATVEKWAEQSPDTFRFAFKLPRLITHDKRLHDVATEVRSFLDVIEPLGDRVGPVQVQLPPSFGPDDVEILLGFLRRLPAGRSWALELRHLGFFENTAARERVDRVCTDRGIARVVLDTRPLHAGPVDSDAAIEEKRTKPAVPVLTDVAGPHPIVRVIGEDRPDGTMAGLLAWVPQVVEWLADGRTPYVFVHQPENLHSPGLARAFHAAVADEVDDLEPLPEPAGQTSMF
ncbi:MAG: DUF72 domain-containing protein [Ilumatobacter sp.]|uniref:DUF72 domain-containing protein n=1 Tax=Ilumatobacter sp. TaxID=1967498 RepID=UPI00329A0E59